MNRNELENLVNEFRNYSKCFSKCGLSVASLYDIENYQVTLTTETYEKRGKAYSKLLESETSVINTRQYARYISGIAFFNDRIEKGYTYAGYIVKKMTCYNPDRTLKVVRKFKYERKEDK